MTAKIAKRKMKKILSMFFSLSNYSVQITCISLQDESAWAE